MTSKEETIERIKQEARELGNDGYTLNNHAVEAIEEILISERNKTAQEAIEIFEEYVKNGSLLNFASYKHRLESLKL